MKQGDQDAAEAGRAGSCPAITFTVPRPATGSGCPVANHNGASAPVRRTTKKRRNGTSAQPMRIAMLGTSNKTSELALRERLAFPPYDLAPAVAALGDAVPHGIILSTCQRVEIYVAAPTLAGV